MKLVPGARIEMQGPSLQGGGNAQDVVVRDARSEKERRFVPHGHQALVIGVEVFDERNPMHTTWVTCFSTEHGFWRCEAPRVKVIWSPVEE